MSARLKTRLMPQGANIPCTPEAEKALHERGVLVVPDFIANAGGVICASIEYRGGTQRAAFDYIDERIRTNTRLVLEDSRRSKDTTARRRAGAGRATRACGHGNAALALTYRFVSASAAVAYVDARRFMNSPGKCDVHAMTCVIASRSYSSFER